MISLRAMARARRHLVRSYSTPTAHLRLPAAAAAHAQPQQDYYEHSRPSSSQKNGSASPFRSLPRIHLPPPLPNDIPAPPNSLQASLYPSTGVIDAISMISICLRRPDHIPRAYQIFSQLLHDSMTGQTRTPDAKIWEMVIEGVASLAKPDTGGEGEKWRRRAEGLVEKWGEAFNEMGQRPVGLEHHDGIRVYRGWLKGLINAQSSIRPTIPYLSHRSLSIASLLQGVEPSTLPYTCQLLVETAEEYGMEEFKADVLAFQGHEQQQREANLQEVVEEVTPVAQGAGKPSLGKTPVDSANTSREARFAITNLRQALAPIDSPSMPINRQRALEESSLLAARRELEEHAKRMRETTDHASSSALQRSKLQSWMHTWLGELTKELEQRIAVLQAAADGAVDDTEITRVDTPAAGGMRPQVLLMYLSLLPVDKLALITILEIMRMSGSGGMVDGMKVLRGMVAVGKAVETEFKADTIRNIAGVDSQHWQRSIDPTTQKPSRALIDTVWKKIGEQVADKGKAGEEAPEAPSFSPAASADMQDIWTPAWSRLTQLGIGSELVDALLKIAKVQREGIHPITGEKVVEEQPAFSHAYEYVRGKCLGVIKLNPAVAERLTTDDIGVIIPPKHLPMLVPPRQWTSHDVGGYLLHNIPVMRYKDSLEQQKWLKAASDEGHLEPVYHGLDVLSSTPWKINRKVFDIVLKSWNDGVAIAEIPASEENVTYDYPEKPESTDQDPQKRLMYMEQLKLVVKQQRKDHAERCKVNYNIEIARAYLKDTFYLPHSMDFRGRAYPIPPHLSPVGDDLCRGLLTFGTKKPLGPTGLKWLQIHLANVYGYDKASFAERSRFAQEHEKEIFDSADHPLDGERWWLKAEDPWQCLATCFELASALRSPDPTVYESSLPVHQDGTCNGMQHYAALGGDVRGARAVNLEAGDRPADVYTGVVDIVNQVVEQDKKKGHRVALLIGEPLGRKVVKQTVMTTVYGVTFVGARDQIAKQLKARGDIAQENIFEVSSYIAKTVLACIGDIFSGAKSIMDWLTISARLVSRSIAPERVDKTAENFASKRGTKTSRMNKEFMSAVIWTTPLGLPVVQPYRKAKKRQIMTALQTVYISDPNAPSEVSPQKQAGAFPPNFIHSLDATHMILTALRCKQNNLTFASVHDSYWTHAASIEKMSDLIRDTFVELHSQDLIGKLREEFVERYGDFKVPSASAKLISSSAAKRLVANKKSRKEVAQSFADLDATKKASSGSSEVQTEIVTSAEQDIPESVKEILEEEIAEDDFTADFTGKGAWINVRDLIPPCPPRGVFQVQKVKDSAYFFS